MLAHRPKGLRFTSVLVAFQGGRATAVYDVAVGEGRRRLLPELFVDLPATATSRR